jgi:hypothetical protein
VRGSAFVKLPVALLLDERLRGTQAALIYALICKHVRERPLSGTQAAYPGRELLRKQAGVSPATVKRTILLLEACGWLVVERRPGRTSLYWPGDGKGNRVTDDPTDRAAGARDGRDTPVSGDPTTPFSDDPTNRVTGVHEVDREEVDAVEVEESRANALDRRRSRGRTSEPAPRRSSAQGQGRQDGGMRRGGPEPAGGTPLPIEEAF